MKKALVIFGVVSFCMFACGISPAETIGNPADIHTPMGKGIYSSQMGDFITINAGFDTEFLIEKKFKDKNEGSTDAKLEGVYYMGKFSCTLFKKIQPYVSLGVSDLQMSWKDGTENVKVEAGIAPSWGAGLKAYLWEFEGLGVKIFSTASFRSTKPDRIRSLSVGNRSGDKKKDKFEILEKQATVGLSREFVISGFEAVSIAPYIGAAWSETSTRVRLLKGDYPVNSGADGQKDNWGMFLGADFMFMDNLSLNLEGRIIDQEAISLGFTALF